MTADRYAAGICKPHADFTTLSREVVGVRQVTCRTRILKRRSHYGFGAATGYPEFFDVVDKMLYLYPIPDQAYPLGIIWDGIPFAVVRLPLTPAWIAAYKHELAAAMAGRISCAGW